MQSETASRVTNPELSSNPSGFLRGGHIASLELEIVTIIEACHSVLAIPKSCRPGIDARTIAVARRILATLREVDLGGHFGDDQFE